MAANDLSESILLAALIRAGHDQYLKHARTRVYRRKEFLFAEGDAPDAVYVIKKGTVRLVKQDPSGRDRVVGIYGPGDVMGISEIMDMGAYMTSAVARSKVVATRFPGSVLSEMAKRHTRVALAMNRELAAHVLELQRNVEYLSVGRAQERIANLLVRLASRWHDGTPGKIDLSLTRQEIADMAGVTVETCIRTMSKFKKNGLVTMMPRKTILIDEAALSAVAGAA
ncbi:MAG: Crp/Fnr family transcriptional regulator [Deltaproteobacteria bacterium]|nr:Crp/Fnr family transcriptional regulator [Deltaproteobacteria bacterium]